MWTIGCVCIILFEIPTLFKSLCIYVGFHYSPALFGTIDRSISSVHSIHAPLQYSSSAGTLTLPEHYYFHKIRSMHTLIYAELLTVSQCVAQQHINQWVVNLPLAVQTNFAKERAAIYSCWPFLLPSMLFLSSYAMCQSTATTAHPYYNCINPSRQST